MQFLDYLLKTESYIGLSSLKLKKESKPTFYSGNYNSSFFKFDIHRPLQSSIYFIDQIVCRPS